MPFQTTDPKALLVFNLPLTNNFVLRIGNTTEKCSATLPAFSPRFVGETSYLTGRLQELLNKMPVGNTNRGLYQGGRLNRITEEKK